LRAATITAAALGLLIIGRWAHGKPAFNVQTVVGGAFVVLVIAALDGGATEDIARGMAWLLLAVVILSANSPLTGIAAAINAKASGNPLQTAAQKAAGRGGPNA
jgi:hypothetical protein